MAAPITAPEPALGAPQLAEESAMEKAGSSKSSSQDHEQSETGKKPDSDQAKGFLGTYLVSKEAIECLQWTDHSKSGYSNMATTWTISCTPWV